MRGLSLSPGVGSPPGPPGDLEDEEGLKHLQQVWRGACACSRGLQGCRGPCPSLRHGPLRLASLWTPRRQRSWWPPCRTAPWRRSSLRPPCRPRASATPQPPLPFPSATALPESGSTRTHRGRSKVAVGGRLPGADLPGQTRVLSDPPWPPLTPHALVPGPFTTQEMAEWFQAGYFSMSLLVKRGCDEGFQPLGEVIKMWGRVPFAPGPSPPPLLVSTVRSAGGREGQWGQQRDRGLPHARLARRPGSRWARSHRPALTSRRGTWIRSG